MGQPMAWSSRMACFTKAFMSASKLSPVCRAVTGGSREADFSTSLLATARAASVEMTILWWERREQATDKSKNEMRVFFDSLGMTG